MNKKEKIKYKEAGYIHDLTKEELISECETLLKQIKEDKEKYTVLVCESCNNSFSVENQVDGVITCPYCSDYVEG